MTFNRDIFNPISIHALRVEGDARLRPGLPWPPISIHALRVEGDGAGRAGAGEHHHISIHALRVEGDPAGTGAAAGACGNFYPRPPGGGRRIIKAFSLLPPSISIHALRVEGDAQATRKAPRPQQFLSTPSGWRATSVVHVTYLLRNR